MWVSWGGVPEWGHIVQSAAFAGLYYFFFAGKSDDPEICIASTNDDGIYSELPKEDSVLGGVDVGARFHKFFTWLFYTQAIVTLGLLLWKFDITYDINRLCSHIYLYGNYLICFTWLVGFTIRFQASGRSCSGDGDVPEFAGLDGDFDSGVYLKQQGAFIMIFGIIYMFLFGFRIIDHCLKR